MEFYEKTIKSQRIYDGKILKLDLEDVKLPDGNTSKRELIRHQGGVAIIPFTKDGNIILVEQFRKPLEKVIYEIPAGKLEKGEKIDYCAQRELEEETGYKANDLKYIGKFASSPGYSDEIIYVFSAKNLYSGVKGGDDDEFINIHEVSLQRIKELVKSGEIIDSKLICALALMNL